MNNLICITSAHVIASIDQFDLVFLISALDMFKKYVGSRKATLESYVLKHL